MRNHLLILFAATLLIGLPGCARVVHVVDPAGAPIEGAEVVGVSLSTNTAPVLTDAKGRGRLPDNAQGVKWIAVTKPGYVGVQSDAPKRWPATITLTPAPTP